MQGCGPNKLAPALFAKTMITEAYKTFTEAVDLEWSVPTAGTWLAALLKFDNAPTTHGATHTIKVVLRSSHTERDTDGKLVSGGDNYDTVILEEATTSTKTDYYLAPDIGMPVNRNDKIAVVYSNPDTRTVAITIKGNDSVR